jgi:hypothetical protein
LEIGCWNQHKGVDIKNRQRRQVDDTVKAIAFWQFPCSDVQRCVKEDLRELFHPLRSTMGLNIATTEIEQ